MDKNCSDQSENNWCLIESYFKKKHLDRLVKHQIDSYNEFIEHQMMNTIEMFNPVCIHSDHDYDRELDFYSLEIFIEFKNINMYRAQIHENNGATKLMFPNDARLRNFTYASNVTVDLDIKYVVKSTEDPSIQEVIHKTLPKIHIGKLPIMLKSNICVLNQYKHDTSNCGECKEDPGGYFIINGSEKTCLGQEKAADNKIFCFKVLICVILLATSTCSMPPIIPPVFLRYSNSHSTIGFINEYYSIKIFIIPHCLSILILTCVAAIMIFRF